MNRAKKLRFALSRGPLTRGDKSVASGDKEMLALRYERA